MSVANESTTLCAVRGGWIDGETARFRVDFKTVAALKGKQKGHVPFVSSGDAKFGLGA